jgi:hypothetical protein
MELARHVAQVVHRLIGEPPIEAQGLQFAQFGRRGIGEKRGEHHGKPEEGGRFAHGDHGDRAGVGRAFGKPKVQGLASDETGRAQARVETQVRGNTDGGRLRSEGEVGERVSPVDESQCSRGSCSPRRAPDGRRVVRVASRRRPCRADRRAGVRRRGSTPPRRRVVRPPRSPDRAPTRPHGPGGLAPTGPGGRRSLRSPPAGAVRCRLPTGAFSRRARMRAFVESWENITA